MALATITRVEGTAVFVPGHDIDTDRIIPARFMKCVTFDGLGDAIARVMPQMEKAIEQGTIKVKGPFVLTYPAGSAHRTPERPFTVHVGLLVSDDSTGGGDVKVRACEPFRAATVLYTGPIAGIGQCYQRIFPALDELRLVATGEEREFTLYYESPESPNNVVLVQVGVRDAP